IPELRWSCGRRRSAPQPSSSAFAKLWPNRACLRRYRRSLRDTNSVRRGQRRQRLHAEATIWIVGRLRSANSGEQPPASATRARAGDGGRRWYTTGQARTGEAGVVPAGTGAKEVAMNEDVFNASIRKFLKRARCWRPSIHGHPAGLDRGAHLSISLLT